MLLRCSILEIKPLAADMCYVYFLSFTVLQAVLFNPSRPFRNPTTRDDVELMIDCFVSFYRITPHSNEVLKVVMSVRFL